MWLQPTTTSLHWAIGSSWQGESLFEVAYRSRVKHSRRSIDIQYSLGIISYLLIWCIPFKLPCIDSCFHALRTILRHFCFLRTTLHGVFNLIFKVLLLLLLSLRSVLTEDPPWGGALRVRRIQCIGRLEWRCLTIFGVRDLTGANGALPSSWRLFWNLL